ncbi:DNA-binding domain-containing protein [Bordetella sp. FB-8]|uniref:HvfC/BufC N-terminal domain-containing protein n=1 Tax=Bordetella sp. FB-8 TaxID=1159870 RepID=UPI000368AD01|nr:DNA-binding domain-containing protein [Bordetella sp. FB-8]
MHENPALDDLQRRFFDALHGRGEQDPAAWVEAGGLAPVQRLDIYRHSSEEIHAAALRTAYPAVRALVGDAYFDQTALQYRRAFPSRCGNLQKFGEMFGEFLAMQVQVAGIAYLGDVARLEWQRQQVALAADAQPMSVSAFVDGLALVDGPIRLGLVPSMGVVASAHPVLTIWRFATDPENAPSALPRTGESVLIWRDADQVAMSRLHTASHACIDAIIRGRSVDAAYATAYALDPEFDLSACVMGLVQSHLVMNIQALVPTETEKAS